VAVCEQGRYCRAFPTFHIYHGLDRKQVFQGGKPEQEFRRALEQHLASFPPVPHFNTAAVDALVGGLTQLGGNGGDKLVNASE
jgi:hypothetical protein